MGVDDLHWMRQAYALALQGQSQNEVPVGAVIINSKNELVGQGFNQVIKSHNPIAHAECLAIQEAALNLQNYRLTDCTLYVTLEPCCLCAGAIIHARIKRLVYAARDIKAGAAGSVFNLLSGSSLNHKVQIDEGIMQRECSKLLMDFFKQRRLKTID